ncbi:acetoacetyl-CoA synthetase-like isoform X2 [Parasteatoda tepidariorum]|uniref:acetoacetyl-CoA synthetase-like isoform X2 n=1 Tax=Parasteatoda tepidariorum TaxID=114398 RepID=UPI001C72221D|nr:acetoacetyl-CoA synthetase-like isoform X2 [Parasteatoda tepidariorum]
MIGVSHQNGECLQSSSKERNNNLSNFHYKDGLPCFDAKPKSKSPSLNNKGPILIWNEKVPNTALEKFSKIIEQKYNQKFDSYWDLHKWSVENFPNFWEECWKYFDIIASRPYDQAFIKTGDGFMDNEWFPGALFNFAENILRYRDDREALVCIDEEDGGEDDIVTYAQMFEEVRRYAAAFRKHGLQKGDTVACYMSNRKESIFTFLAAASIGAIFGGPQPYFGPKAALNILNKMEAKFLISIDKHVDNGAYFSNIDYLAEIVSNAPSIEKVIIVATKQETKSRDLSDIPKSILLEDFLDSGKNADGTIPELVFEQLPFSHPVAINFTSGTTGLPKGPVHSAGTLISHLVSIAFYWNLKCGDTVYTCYPVGWTLWDTFVPCLAWGVKLLLFAGCPFYERKDETVWEIFARHKVTYSFFATIIADKLEKMNTVPGSDLDMSNLKLLTMGGSPVKVQNYLFIKEKVKRNVFTCSQYGASESFGTFSGFDLNLPCYAGEIQAPGLGMDVKCFDQKGKSVLNRRGEMVLAKPTPSLPVFIWKDEDHSIMKETYLSKYPGVWCQNDEIWINPDTKGLVVIGRSDDTLKQFGERFGAGDVYFAIHDMEEIQDYICVGQNRDDGETRAVLFVKMREGHSYTPEFKRKIEQKIFDELWQDCVPQVILEVSGIPYNLNNKKMESTVRKIVATNQVPEVNNIKNPECLLDYLDIPELVNYNNI